MNWTDNLKPGDTVIAFDRRGEVLRLTATQVVFKLFGREHRASRTTLRVVGHAAGFRAKSIREATPEALARLRAAEDVSWARYHLSAIAEALPAEKLAALRAFVEAL